MLDAPTFPVVLVSNGIHHIVPTKLLTVEKLVDLEGWFSTTSLKPSKGFVVRSRS